METMWRSKSFWLVLIVVALATGAGYTYYQDNVAQSQEDAEPPMRTTRVRRGSLEIVATGTGSLVAADEISLGFRSSGLVAAVLVEIGDPVEADDVLARLDDSDAQKAIKTAEIKVAQAEATLSNQEDPAAHQRTVALAQIQVSQAEINLASAKLKLDELLDWAPDATAVQQAQASLDAAQADYEATRSRSDYDTTTSSRIALAQAQADLVDAQEAYDTAWDPARDWELNDRRLSSKLESEREGTERGLKRAQDNLEIAWANYNLTLAGVNDSDELNAWTKVVNAQATLDNAQQSPAEGDVEAARLSVQQAELSLAQAQINLEEAMLDADTTQAELSLAQAELDLESARDALQDTLLVAPITGTVVLADVQAGEWAGTSAVFTLADLSRPMVEIYLDETDLDKIAVGKPVEVVFDALPDDVFSGRVVLIEPELIMFEGVPTVQALAALEMEGVSIPLPAGLNASVDIISARAENTLLIPIEALRELAAGEYAVFVVENGTLKARSVEVGLMDYANAEILGGLDLGDEVSTGIVDTE